MSFFTKDDGRFMGAIRRVDRFIIPFMAGVVVVSIVAQCVASIPIIRRSVDARANRFIPVTSSTDEVTSGDISLTISPSIPNPDVLVYLNGKAAGSFKSLTVNLSVREGDQVEIRNQSEPPKPCYVVVGTNSSNLVSPGDGFEIDLTDGTNSAFLPVVHFFN